MRRSLYPLIDNNYDPKAESADSIRAYHTGNKEISRLLLSAQLIFPPCALICTILLLHFHFRPYFLREHDYKRKSEENKTGSKGRESDSGSESQGEVQGENESGSPGRTGGESLGEVQGGDGVESHGGNGGESHGGTGVENQAENRGESLQSVNRGESQDRTGGDNQKKYRFCCFVQVEAPTREEDDWVLVSNDTSYYTELVQFDAKVKLATAFIISVLFSIYSFAMSVIAVYNARKTNRRDDFEQWTYSIDDTDELQTLFAILVVMMISDFLVIFVLIIFVLCSCAVKSERDNIAKSWLWMGFLYSIFAPVTSLAIHANHIIIAFIHNQEHAVSVGIFYIIIVVSNIFIIRTIASFSCRNAKIGLEFPRVICNILLFCAFSITFEGLLIYIASIYVLIPINNAFDKAPARLRLIYDGLLVGFAALFTYKFILKRKKKKDGPPPLM